MKDDDRRSIALWRVSVLGPLVSARLEHGDRKTYFEETAARVHKRPDGKEVRLSPRTVEDWFYLYRTGGLAALEPQTRTDLGRSRSISPDIAELILRIKRERPRRSIRRIIRMLERARRVRPGDLKKSSVHRLLRAQHVSARPVRGPSAERRSFLPEHAGDLWFGDALHGPIVIAPDGKPGKAYLLTQLDAATRFVPNSYFAMSEGAVDHEYGLKESLLKHGPPRVYYVDLGSAYVADSLSAICAELGIHLVHTAPKDCEAKGAIERWHRTWREEVGDELDEDPIPLADLNAIHWAWLAAEYHARVHETTGRAPKEHWLDEVAQLQKLRAGTDLDDVFLHREKRKVRKDGTVRFKGQLLEVRPELVGEEVELRFDPTDKDALPRVFKDRRFVSDTVRLDRQRNVTRRRLRPKGDAAPNSEPSGIDPLALIQDEHYRRTRPVGADQERRRARDEEDES